MVTKILAFLITTLTPTAHAQNNLGTLSWGLHNSGASQQILIDHYTSGLILGVPGEDIAPPAPTSTTRKVIVAVLDTGVDSTHPQLKDALVSPGFNLINNTRDTTDTHGHGTHISGIIAGRLNGSGFQGVSQNAMILPIKVVQTGPNAPIRPQDVSPGAGTALTETVAKGIVTAIQNGAEVINLSLAWPSSIRSKKVDDAMALAKERRVIIVSSAGNDSTTANVYPCIYDNVICVGSHGPDGSFSHFSNYGSMVDVLAPGAAILSLWPQKKAPVTFAGQVGYEFRNGTSMAAPFVAGAIAELLSRGYSPEEAKNRIFLGSRPTRNQSLFKSDVLGDFSKNTSTETKSARFGNLDLSGALAVNPSPLILPAKKGVLEVLWDGSARELSLPLDFKNLWLKSGAVSISIEDQSFNFDSIDSGATVTLPYILRLGDRPESTLHLKARVITEGFTKTELEITISLVRFLNAQNLPATAKVRTLIGVDPATFDGMRSVVNAKADASPDFVLTRKETGGVTLSLLKGNVSAGSVSFPLLSPDQLLNLYKLPDDSYCAIFTKQDPNEPRPSFILKMLSSNFQFLTEAKIGTDLTVLSENFKWVAHKGSYTPLWISLGFTPKKDLPAYDPWNPKSVDLKMPRLFYLDSGELRIVHLKKDQVPLQVLLNGSVLTARGNQYLQTYELLTINDGVISSSSTLSLSEYRMLIGLDPGTSLVDVNGKPSSTTVLSGASIPGSLRVSGIGENGFDQILKRSTPLDSIVSILGAYGDGPNQYFFVQTHYDLQFFSTRSMNAVSTSLNRYSYIPSMIFGRSFYPAVAKAAEGQGIPAMYIPASIANNNTSEVVVADPLKGKLMRPASLHLRVQDPNCVGLGNLIRPQGSEPSHQVFICGTQLIEVPLTLEPTTDGSAPR